MWRQSYRLSGHYTLRGHSRSTEMTCFYIPELNFYFDAGVWSNYECQHIAITHCHGDHIQCLNGIIQTQSVGRDHPIQVYCPVACSPLLRRYIDSYQQLNYMNPRHRSDGTVKIHEFKSGHKQGLTIGGRPFCLETVECDHSVATLGYGLCEMRKRLRPEYVGRSQCELISLKNSGQEIEHLIEAPLIMYLGDTTHRVFENRDLYRYPVIVVECTFLEESDLKEAESRKHIHWSHLEPVIHAHREITFILIHFSLRYSDRDIATFFGKPGRLRPNMVIWTDAKIILTSSQKSQKIT